MRHLVLTIVLVVTPMAAPAAPPESAARFDGDWMTTVSCPNSGDAMGFSFDVPTLISAGALHGERLTPGQPGWLVIDGQIGPDGRADLYAKGLVGAAPFAVGHRPKGTDYGYHVEAQFQGDRGTGRRIEGRRCDLSFVRR